MSGLRLWSDRYSGADCGRPCFIHRFRVSRNGVSFFGAKFQADMPDAGDKVAARLIHLVSLPEKHCDVAFERRILKCQ